MSDVNGSSTGGFQVTPRLIITATIAVLAAIFIAQNRASAELRLIFFTVSMPRWIAFLVLLLAGGVIGWVVKGQRDKRRR